MHFHFDDLSFLCVFFCYSLFDCNCQIAIVAIVVIIFIVIIVDLSMYPTNVCLSVSMSVCLSFFVWLLCKSVSSLSTKTKIIYIIFLIVAVVWYFFYTLDLYVIIVFVVIGSVVVAGRVEINFVMHECLDIFLFFLVFFQLQLLICCCGRCHRCLLLFLSEGCYFYRFMQPTTTTTCVYFSQIESNVCNLFFLQILIFFFRFSSHFKWVHNTS